MSLPISARGNPRSSGYKRNVNDWYVEPAISVRKLLDAEHFEGVIWDPACGSGNIIDVCQQSGLNAIGTDLVDRANGRFATADFFEEYVQQDNIITNPPFNMATSFTIKALGLARYKVCILARLAWLEGENRGRLLFDTGVLAHVWVFRKRISMPPGGMAIPAKNGSVAFAWFVFDHSYDRTEPTLGWL